MCSATTEDLKSILFQEIQCIDTWTNEMLFGLIPFRENGGFGAPSRITRLTQGSVSCDVTPSAFHTGRGISHVSQETLGSMELVCRCTDDTRSLFACVRHSRHISVDVTLASQTELGHARSLAVTLAVRGRNTEQVPRHTDCRLARKFSRCAR